MPSIREARMEDLEALGQIAYATGYFGASAKVYFPSPALFRDLWVRPYLAGGGSLSLSKGTSKVCNLVADKDGKPVGYIIGTTDMTHYQRWMRGYALHLLKDALFGRYPKLLPSLRYLLRMARYPSRLAPIEHFPAQLHINLLPEARGLGLGAALMERYLGCLESQQIKGVQLSTTRENVAAVRLYEKFGFEVLREYSSPLWRPWLGRDAVHLIMGKKFVER